MPYISQQERTALSERVPESVGELNYIITRSVDRWIQQGTINYNRLNAAIGVLECAKLEIYRRVVASYEAGKLEDNGEVYDVLAKNSTVFRKRP